MYNNIYDSTKREHDSNLYNDNCNTDYDRNFDFCPDNYYGQVNLPADYMGLFYKIDRMEKKIHDLSKKKHRKKKKKCHNSNKKLKKRLKKAEMQNAYMAEYIAATMSQTKSEGKYDWLKRSIETSAPRIIDLVSNVVESKRQPLPKTMNQPLCLPDKQSMK